MPLFAPQVRRFALLICCALMCLPAAAAQARRPLVAVADSGVDVGVPAIARHLWTNPREVAGNGRDDDRDGVVDDVHGADFVAGDGTPEDATGHGTMVAGIIARSRWARILPVRVVGADGHGSEPALARGIDYAVARHARIINLSLAGYRPTPGLRAALARASRAGVMIVTAAGNAPMDLDVAPDYPASFGLPGEIVAAAFDGSGLAAFSARGRHSVDLAAPGVGVLSQVPGGAWARLTGTSASVAEVSAVAARLMHAFPHRSVRAIEHAMVRGALRRESLLGLVGGGLLSTAGAMRLLDAHQ